MHARVASSCPSHEHRGGCLVAVFAARSVMGWVVAVGCAAVALHEGDGCLGG